MRFIKTLIITTVLTLIISEWVYTLQGNPIDRGPETIELIIPPGTADLVARGEDVVSIPDNFTFVVGDTFVVINQDSVAHELQPHLIPPGTSASITMDEENSLIVNCSFSSSKYLGISIKTATTWKTRLLAVFFAAPPTAIIAFFYSLAIKPIVVEESESEKKAK